MCGLDVEDDGGGERRISIGGRVIPSERSVSWWCGSFESAFLDLKLELEKA